MKDRPKYRIWAQLIIDDGEKLLTVEAGTNDKLKAKLAWNSIQYNTKDFEWIR